jgi:hypothetical protein
MDPGQITAVILASIICGTITIGLIAQAWTSGRAGGRGGAAMPTRLDALEERLHRLEQAIDTVAIEVERGTEAQRFTAKLLAERLDTSSSAARIGSRSQEH